MNKTLYLIRKPVDRINPAMFVPSETEGDVVLLEEGGSFRLVHRGGAVFSLSEHAPHPRMTYDELVEMIFQSDRAMVI